MKKLLFFFGCLLLTALLAFTAGKYCQFSAEVNEKHWVPSYEEGRLNAKYWYSDKYTCLSIFDKQCIEWDIFVDTDTELTPKQRCELQNVLADFAVITARDVSEVLKSIDVEHTKVVCESTGYVDGEKLTYEFENFRKLKDL